MMIAWRVTGLRLLADSKDGSDTAPYVDSERVDIVDFLGLAPSTKVT